MLSELMTYGAVATKMRAMYGKRLVNDDFRRMAAMKTVPEVAMFLRDHPAWGGALDAVDVNALTRNRIEYILRRHFLLTYLRLFSYIERSDQPFLRFPVLTVENEEMMRFMRLAMNGRPEQYTYDLPSYFNRYSRIHYEELSAAATYDDMLKAVSETDFFDSLQRIRPAGEGFPSYLEVETAMRRYTYRALYRLAEKKGGDVGDSLREALGVQADWENILLIERILRYYPDMLSNIAAYLLPVRAHLSPFHIHAMYTAESVEKMRAFLMESTFYGRYLRERQEMGYPLEKLSNLYQMEYYHKHLVMDGPSLFAPIAFYHLYRNELLNLIHVIECVRYELPPEDAEAFLVL